MSDNEKQLVGTIITNERILTNMKYGVPRPGHAEGTVGKHVQELIENITKMDAEDYPGRELVNKHFWKLLILVLVHDSFKAESGRNLPLLDPNSHSSLAKEFLFQHTDDEDLLNIVQYHDLGYVVYRSFKERGTINHKRIEEGLAKIKNKDLFLLFCIIDGCTESKGREMLEWFVNYVHVMYSTTVDRTYILPGGGKFVEGQTW